MSLRSGLLWVSLAACAGPAGSSQPTDAAVLQPTYTLRYASPYSPRHPFSRADQAWIEHIQTASHGALRIDPFWSGTLISADHGVIELRHGVADLAAIQPIYERGGSHALRTQTGFYAGAEHFEEQVAIYKCLSQHYPVFDEELHGLTVLAVQGGNLPGIVTRSAPVSNLTQLRGLRLRAPAELMELLSTLGADPVNMPMGEVYAALARGVIDGVVAPLDALRSLHLAEVAHHYGALAIPRGAYPARAIRSARLQQLPAALQDLLRDSTPVWELALERELADAQRSGLDYAKRHGIQVTHFTPEDQSAFNAAYNRAAGERARALVQRGVAGDAIFAAAQAWIARVRAQPLPKPVSRTFARVCPRE